MKNKRIVLGILFGFVVAIFGTSFFAYKVGYGDGYVHASNNTNERWAAQSKDMINENNQFVRVLSQPATN